MPKKRLIDIEDILYAIRHTDDPVTGHINKETITKHQYKIYIKAIIETKNCSVARNVEIPKAVFKKLAKQKLIKSLRNNDRKFEHFVITEKGKKLLQPDPNQYVAVINRWGSAADRWGSADQWSEEIVQPTYITLNRHNEWTGTANYSTSTSTGTGNAYYISSFTTY